MENELYGSAGGHRNVDPLYEAAQVDGAGRWKQVLHVTLPCILPMVAVLTVLGLGNILNAGLNRF